MKKRTIVCIIILGFLLLAVLSGKILMTVATANLEQLRTLAIETPELSLLANGTYRGTYKTFPLDVEVEVVVLEQKIVGIDILKHVNGQGAAAQTIPSDVIKNQSLRVDAVSGATYSSIVILKAIEDALSE